MAVVIVVVVVAVAGGQNGADSAMMQADSPMSNTRRYAKKTTVSVSSKQDDEEEPMCPQLATDPTSCSAAPPADFIRCQSDSDCSSFSGRMCCYDGCRFACLVAVAPPPCTLRAVYSLLQSDLCLLIRCRR